VAFGCVDRIGDPEMGDLLFFQYGRVCSHIGIYIGNGEMVHAFYGLLVAVRQPLTGDLQRRLKRVMRTPWVTN
jgi:cell wall-associated NlpC family hydrolase